MSAALRDPLRLLPLGMLFLLLGASARGAAEAPAAQPPQTWTPQQFGAVADGSVLDTGALQQAIDAAHAAGGGVVRLAAGRYLTGSLTLRSGVTLRLERDATLLGSPRIADYRRGAKWPALLIAVGQQRIALEGEGVIDGQGARVAADSVRLFESGDLLGFFPGVPPGQKVNLGGDTVGARVIEPHALHRAGQLAAIVAPRSRADLATWRVDECVRPQLIEFSHCREVRVVGLTLRDAANWVQTYRECEDVLLSGLRVRSTTYWNNDGLDLVDSRRVRVEDCDIDAADDGICLKSEATPASRGCEDIAILRCRVRSSANALKFGTASHHAFRRIRVDDLAVRDTYRSVVALEAVDGAVIEDVQIRHVRATQVGNAFFLRIGQRNAGKPAGALRRVLLEDFHVQIAAGKPDAGYPHEGPPPKVATNVLPSSIVGLPERPVEDVVLRDVVIEHPGGGRTDVACVPLDRLADVPERRDSYPEFNTFGELPAWALFLRDVRGLRLERVAVRRAASDYRAAIVADRVAALTFAQLEVQGPAAPAPGLVLAGAEAVGLDTISWGSSHADPLLRLTPFSPHR